MVLHTMVIIDAPQSPEKDLTVTEWKTVHSHEIGILSDRLISFLVYQMWFSHIINISLLLTF